MKRTLLLIAISVIAFKGHAQTEAGKFMLGGGALFNSTKSSPFNIKGTVIAIIPQAGYFVQKNLAIGLAIGYQHQTYNSNNINSEVINTSKNQINTFVIAPFARHYTNITEQFRFFGQLSVPMNFGTTKANDPVSGDFVKQSTNRNIGAKISPGFAFFPGGSKVSFEFSVDGLSYNHASTTYDSSVPAYNNGNKVSSNQFNIGANLLSPTISIYFYL